MTTFSRQDLDRIRSTASELVEKYRMPGMALGVVSGQDLVLAEGYGNADIESNRPQALGLLRATVIIWGSQEGALPLLWGYGCPHTPQGGRDPRPIEPSNPRRWTLQRR